MGLTGLFFLSEWFFFLIYFVMVLKYYSMYLVRKKKSWDTDMDYVSLDYFGN